MYAILTHGYPCASPPQPGLPGEWDAIDFASCVHAPCSIWVPYYLSVVSDCQDQALTDPCTGAVLYSPPGGFHQTGARWNGVECNADNEVVKIHVDNSNVTCNISAIDFSNLTKLTTIQMEDNALVGNLPRSLTALPALRAVYFKNNQLSGTLDDTAILGTTSLSKLDLSYQDPGISGTLPGSIGHLTMLTKLNLSHNRFSGAIPPSIANMSSLQTLTVGGNLFTGTLPDLPASLTIFSAGGVSPAGDSNAFSCPFPSNHPAFQDVQCTCLAGSYCPR
jgi:hypothetical protein